MKQILLINAQVITPTGILPHHCVQVQDGKITALVPMTAQPTPTPDTEVMDAQNAYAAPGLIDMHIHGFGGFGPEQASEQGLLQLSKALAATGVTAFCPTLYCARPEEMERILQATVGAFGKETGARLVGYHLEGPFISPDKPGVMKPQDIAPADVSVLEKLYHAARGHITQITVAPELPGIEEIAAFCREHHILLQAGHTNATYEEFMRGAQLGITHATHLFNAMSGLHHRAPGAAGAVLFHPKLSAEIIADGHHVHPDLVAFLRQVKPIENIVFVTDALLPTGQPTGPFVANGEAVILDGGVWKRPADGVWAGSALTLLQAVKNAVSWGYLLPEAVACASTHPARLLGLCHKGTLAVGMDADILLFDAQFRPLRTLLSGK